MDWVAIWLSIKLSFLTMVILTAIGLPLAYWLAFSRCRARFVVESLVALPLVLPPTVLGFYTLIALGPHSPVGALYESLTDKLLPFSFEGLLIASVLYSLPFTVQPFTAAFRGVDPRPVEASWTLGVSRIATFFRLIIPLSMPGLITGMVLSFAHTMGEFGVVLMVGGNIPGETRTVAVSIYDEVQALDYSAANRMSLLLLGFSFTVIALTYALQGRRQSSLWTLR